MDTDILSETDLRARCIQGYEWPEDLREFMDEQTKQFTFDRDKLLSLACRVPKDQYFVLAFLSSEYFKLGILWAQFAAEAGVKCFALAAVDTETEIGLERLNIPYVRVYLPAQFTVTKGYRNRGGFKKKGMGIIHTRLHVVQYLIEKGINVICSDVDALLTKSPFPVLANSPSIAFQRVVYFPRPLARMWGFTICAGFVAYRTDECVARFLRQVVAAQTKISSDQLALNLTLYDQGVRWCSAYDTGYTDRELKKKFLGFASRSIYGWIPNTGLSLEALPATTFWRHEFVALDRRLGVVLHPNSPKTQQGKFDVLGNVLTGRHKRILQSVLT